MNMKHRDASKDTTITVQIPSEVSDELEAMARDTERSTAHLASKAISDFVKNNSWQVARIKASLEEARSGALGIPHHRVMGVDAQLGDWPRASSTRARRLATWKSFGYHRLSKMRSVPLLSPATRIQTLRNVCNSPLQKQPQTWLTFLSEGAQAG